MATPAPTIRPYRPEDVPALAALFHRAVHAIPDRLYGATERELWAPSPPEPDRWAERFAAAPPAVAIVEGAVAGFMTLEPDGHLAMAYVDPTHQRRGVAAALLTHLETRAEELRLGRLFAEVSRAARPFFERFGFRAVRANQVAREGRLLANWIMDRRLVPLEDRGRIFVAGNSGAGKSTLARALAERLGRTRVDLDEVAFLDPQGTRRAVEDSMAMLRERAGLDEAVVEGCYADLMEALATTDDHLVWLDLSVDDCITNAEARPWEPHKWPSVEAQDAFLPRLLEFIATYPNSAAPTGRPAHAGLFESFGGTKERHTERPAGPWMAPPSSR